MIYCELLLKVIVSFITHLTGGACTTIQSFKADLFCITQYYDNTFVELK